MSDDTDLQQVLTLVRSVDRKLTTLLEMMAREEDEQEEAARTLDGEPAGAERDTSQSLG